MNKECIKLMKVNLEGNIIPISWHEHIKKGKKQITDLLAISVLAYVLNRYNSINTDDTSKEFGNYNIKKSYMDYANLFGFPKKTVKEAVDNLVQYKLILRNFTLSNNMYLEPIIENIKRITQPREEV